MKVAIISRESDDKSIDIAMLEKELADRGIEVKTLCRLLRKEKSIRSLSYVAEIGKQIKAIAESDVVVLDTYCIPVSMLPHLKKTKVIQMWHALSAIKKFGWQTVGRDGGSSSVTAHIMRMHKGYDYVISCSDITSDYFCEAFACDRSIIVKRGLPRIDYIKAICSGDGGSKLKNDIYLAYPELKKSGRKTVLYVPTFRKGKAIDVKGLAEGIDKDKFDVVVKLHPLDTVTPEREIPKNVIIDRIFDSLEWLAVADVVISDYSSFVVEASLAEKPLYIYDYDLDEYKESVGLNMDFEAEPIAPYVFSDGAAIGNAIDGEYDLNLLEEFRNRYIDIDTSNCTKDLAGFIEDLA